MPKTIDTLVSDIYAVFDTPQEIDPDKVKAFGVRLGDMLAERLTENKDRTHLRLSNLGKPCTRQLWYEVNTKELGEPMTGNTRIKFLMGDIAEALILFLAEVAGHDVTRHQEEVSIGDVPGHLDAVVDGELVDVKSCSPYSYLKFKGGLKTEDDAFGYLTQLGSYASAIGHKRAHFLAVDKVLGHLHLDTHEFEEVDYVGRAKNVRDILEANAPPDRGFEDVPDGKSGNRKLGVNCSYCAFKTTCFPGVRPVGYANGVRFLTRVVREPRVEG